MIARSLPALTALLAAFQLCACSLPAPRPQAAGAVRIEALLNTAESWPSPGYAEALFGLRPLHDGKGGGAVLAITRAALQTNPQLTPAAALSLAATIAREASRDGIPPEFLAALLLQESALDPRALSWAGAVGIAQFMPETAADEGVDPDDPYDAIRGAAQLVGGYVRKYSSAFAFPYSEALAAYNAGPGAVDAYHGIPPYAQTRDYINDVFDRWSKIVSSESKK